ncbi:hypothetical protein [Calothrix rhizosoleniae]|uniref:hypothetical protein n=1 Tax=Calothrix rhizosoleniae TaxID=888997 RepID=UPI00190EAF51|nr:hypothetical protein [Calothrix rhizosoleniae]
MVQDVSYVTFCFALHLPAKCCSLFSFLRINGDGDEVAVEEVGVLTTDTNFIIYYEAIAS